MTEQNCWLRLTHTSSRRSSTSWMDAGVPPERVEAFARIFYLPRSRQRPDDHARLEHHLQSARDRFQALDEDNQAAFRDRLGAFVNLYAFLSQIIPYGDSELEQLSSFGRYLIPHLRARAGWRRDSPQR